MSDSEEEYGYTHHKTSGGLTYSVWKVRNSSNLTGNYLSILTSKAGDSDHITQVTIDVTEVDAGVQIHSPEQTTSDSFDSPDAAFAYVDDFALEHGLVSFDPKSRDRDTI